MSRRGGHDASGKMIVTIAEPLEIKGEQAVVPADITIDTLTKLVSNVSTDENIQGFLLDADGMVVSHQNKDYLPKEEGNTSLAKALSVNVKEASEITDYDGYSKFIHTAQITATGWTFGVTERESVNNTSGEECDFSCRNRGCPFDSRNSSYHCQCEEKFETA